MCVCIAVIAYHCVVKIVNLLLNIMTLHSYMVDAADHEKIEASKNELHSLIDKPQLASIPVLVLGNKVDLPNALREKEIIERM